MSDIEVLAKNTTQVTTREEDGATSIMTLYARLFAEMRTDSANLDRLSGDQTDACFRIAVHGTATRAKIAISEMLKCSGPLA